ncbi:MAG: PrsW family intramembrane metalloprotease [Ignavibacteria bacterium]|nr:PrsW family intramembrane metalloprotease [Ignavibacteria bacterium]
MIQFIGSIFAAVIPIFIYLLIIWWLDRNEREPFGFLFLNFFWGATGAIFLAIIGSIIFQISLSSFIIAVSDNNPEELISISGAVITAPVVEEFTKGIFLLMMAMSRKFDGVVDGVVYGGAIGLGFGMTENFLYFIAEQENWIAIVIVRTLFSAILHTLAQATFGAFVGFAKFKSAGFKLFMIPLGYFFAVLIHFFWNLTVSFDGTAFFGFIFVFFYAIGLIIVFQIALYHEQKIITRELAEELQFGIIPREHLSFLPYVSRRKSKVWLPVNFQKKRYIDYTITLALRKDQLRKIGQRNITYEREIEALRNNIRALFG